MTWESDVLNCDETVGEFLVVPDITDVFPASYGVISLMEWMLLHFSHCYGLLGFYLLIEKQVF